MKMVLSKQQTDIVMSDAKNIIVDAAAGSGKTRVLVERVRRLLNNGADPSSFVVITFTNEAANELKSRLSDICNSDKCFIGTIHSYAHKLLKKFGFDFEIFSEYYQTEYMNYLIKKYALYCTFDDYLDFLKYDKLAVSGKISRSSIQSKFSDTKIYSELMQLLGRVPSSYYKETVLTLCKANNVISFDELIELSTKYFSESDTSVGYLFVDELQDIGYLEYSFLMSLNAANNFVIGDDYQAIFGFKGGDVNIFLSLMENKDWTSFTLSENYRTAKSILNYANSIIKKADNIISKDVICKNSNVGELSFIAKSQLDKFLSKLNADEQWFILARSNREMNMISIALSKMNKNHYCFKRSVSNSSTYDAVKNKNCIVVMTIHAAKGLESERVAIYGKFKADAKDMDSDEIKVYYVALTRAKNKCVVFV